MILIYGLTLMTLAAAGVAGHQLVKVSHRKRQFESQLFAMENQKCKKVFDAIEADDRRALLRNSVDRGTSAVELVHRAITTSTFELIERYSKNERLRLNTRQAREIHDDASRGVYRSIRVANKHVHALASVIIRQNRQRNTQAKAPSPQKQDGTDEPPS